tara:strand:- start:338 stop:679 length:342 start_codon:yes stop_codon:yes gene_type:complete
MDLNSNIKEWVNLDNAIKSRGDELKRLREQRSSLTSNITNYVNDNNLAQATIEITDGMLKFHTVKQTSPLTFKFLETCLKECIGNEEQVVNIIKYIKSKREVKYYNDIKRSYK